MNEFNVIFEIEPVAKGRPRFTRNGHAYTPERTRRFENLIKSIAMDVRPIRPFEGPLIVVIEFMLVRPKSAKHREYPIVKPDIDNFFKALTDSVNGIYWRDDAQIIDMHCRKVYGPKAQISIQITQLTKLVEFN